MCIATSIIVVYIPQLQHLIPDPVLMIVAEFYTGSGISPQVTKTPANWGVMQPEVDPRQLLLRLISQEPLSNIMLDKGFVK